MPTIDPSRLPERQVYFLMTSLVVPRPIAWVSTLAPDGTRNIAPHSFFNVVSTNPPIVHFTSSSVKDTLRNVRASGEFVVNIVSEDLLEAMNFTATDFPPDEDEFRWADLAAEPSARVAPPRVAAARAALECRLHRELTVGSGIMVFGEVVHAHVADEVWRDDRVDPEILRPVGRLAGSLYSTTGQVLRLPRPNWAQVRHGGVTAPGHGEARAPRRRP